MKMSNEACNFALKNALEEIKNVCPEIHSAFIFKENGEIVAEDQTTPDVKINNAQEAFRSLAEKASPIGGIESLTVSGKLARANISRFNDFYVGNVASSEADEKAVANLTRVMIPTMLKLVQQIYPSTPQPAPESHVQVKSPEVQEVTYTHYESEQQDTRFMVETIGGFGQILNNPDVAFIDNSLLIQWGETYGDKRIDRVTLEVPTTGKTVQCYYKPFKDSKYEGKGLVLLSDKLQKAIEVQKGAHVIIKPVVSQQETTSALQSQEETEAETKEDLSPPQTGFYARPEQFLPNAPTNQFIVETLKGIGGFLGTPDFVRVDSAVIAQWKELFGDKEIKEVIIQEIVTGKRVSCKFQPLKDQNLEGKGVVQLPEKIQQVLNAKKGGLVMVKPVVD